MVHLGVNVDHFATLRQARYKTPHFKEEPSPFALSEICVRAGADNITVHLREDRRHIQDRDVILMKKKLKAPLNLEMALTTPMIDFALRWKPSEVCIVPEKRQEITTEGGLDVISPFKRLVVATQKIQAKGILVSLFIDPIEEQVKAASATGAHSIELHTGCFAEARLKRDQNHELKRLVRAFHLAKSLGLNVNAGHGLDRKNIIPFLKALPDIHTLNIGHTIVARSTEIGVFAAVQEMKALLSS